MKNSKKILVSLLSMLMLLSIIPSTLVGASDGQLSIKPIQPIEGLRKDCIRGVDISSLEKVEFYGGKFFDNGKERDVLDILKDRGINWVRLRLWNDPVLDGGFCDKESVVAMAKRVKAHGFKILLNFHYSDHWADPGQQTKPAKWADLSFEELKQAVYDYTYEVVSELKEAGALPDMIQIGNEIRSGMLWPDGKSWGEGGGEFDRLAELLKCGIKAVHDVAGDESVKIALHLDNGHDNGAYRWWFDEITERDVDFDVIGMSWYPYWHGNLEQLKYNMNDISARYDKEVAVFETAYGFTLRDADGHANIFGSEQRDIAGYPASVQGQADLLYDVFKAVADVPNNRGLGVFYWEPAWLGVEGAGWIEGQGNAWENQAMFDFGGNALDSLYVFGGIVEPVVVGYEAVEVQTDVFVAPELPETITAWYTDGIARNVKVTWEAIDEGAYQNEGSFSVIGTVEGTSKMATANVIVNPIKDTPQEPIIPPVEPADPIEPPSEPEEPVETEWVVVDDITIKGTGHIQGLSIDKDNDGVYKDKVFTLGTIGESRRLEGFTLDIEGSGVLSDMMLVYRAHVQTYGDMPSPKDVTNHIWRDNMGNPWNKGGTYLGTKAERKRVEGIELRLIDKKTKKEYEGYKIQYQVHMQGYGWGIDDLENDFRDNGKIDDSFDKWAANGEFAGTRGQSRRIEAIRIRILREQPVSR